MNYKNLFSAFAVLSGILFLMGCRATTLVSTPIETTDTVPLKISELTEAEKKTWGHADLMVDTIPGMSVDKAYSELLKNKEGETVVVAVLDGGVDVAHEDLDEVLWTNIDEVPNNGEDDDGNGYVDDVYGYNFLGESYHEQLEYVRMLRVQVGDTAQRAKARRIWERQYPRVLQNQQQYQQILQAVQKAHQAVTEVLGTSSYTRAELQAMQPDTDSMEQNIVFLASMLIDKQNIPEVIEELTQGLTYFSNQAMYTLNKDFNGRRAVGDDPYDITDTAYGNENPKNYAATESHGTHVAGIIAAERNNGKGVNGVAHNVKIMSLRAVPNGDEYDKDIALGIRYAVDNGAKIINCSFGKSFSPNAEWVYDAIQYAAENDVLIVHAAGNSANDLDDLTKLNYPNDHKMSETEFVDNVITVGALTSYYGPTLVASFSNYGQRNVDIFAPGDAIYSTMPNNTYDFQGGTSMAAPAVSGIAALIRSYYPQFSAAQVKHIIMQSGLALKTAVMVGGNASKATSFNKLSKSGKMANAYNALVLAEQLAKGKATL